MDKKAITPRSKVELLREYPIEGLADGWFFRQLEVSTGCYIVEGTDIYGHTVSKTTSDPEVALAECVAFAHQTIRQDIIDDAERFDEPVRSVVIAVSEFTRSLPVDRPCPFCQSPIQVLHANPTFSGTLQIKCDCGKCTTWFRGL